LSNVTLAEADRLRGTDSNPLESRQSVGFARLLLGAVAIGAASASMSYAQKWATTRYAFGKPLAAYEGVAFDIADHDTRLSMARLTLRKAAHDVHQAIDSESIDSIVARTLARVTSISAAACSDGVQLMGVHGIINEHPQELFYRTAGSLSALDSDPLQAGVFRL
jgi:alkylation response protein AidB-like acyl-CoA dehydrogenase